MERNAAITRVTLWVNRFICLLLALSVTVFADGNAKVTANIAADEVKRGEEITVSVSLENCAPLKSMAITPNFNKDVFEVVSGKWLLDGEGALIANFNGVSGATAFSKEVSLNGVIFEFVLKAKADAKLAASDITVDVVIKNGNTAIAADVTGDSVGVACTHDFGEWTTTKEATCAKAGEQERVCKHADCQVKETQSVKKLAHTYGSYSVTTEATCGVAGVETKTCKVCGKETTREIAALEHAYGEWVVVEEATEEKAGKKTQTCANCNDVIEEEIAKLEPAPTEPTEPATQAPTTQPATQAPSTEAPAEDNGAMLWIVIAAVAAVAVVVVIVIVAKKKK